MKFPNIIDHTSVAMKRLALASRVSAFVVLAAGSAHALTTSQTFNLGTSPACTVFPTNGASSLVIWIAKGSLPVGSILRSVSADNVKIEINPNGEWYAWDIGVFVDPTPETPGGPGGLLTIGNDDNFGGAANQLLWVNGESSPFSETITDTDVVSWTPEIDLHTAAVMIGNSAYIGGTGFSGKITVTYDLVDTPPGDPFESWITTRYPELSDKTPTGDPDGDGMSNQAEFAFGLDPSKGSSCNPITKPLGRITGTFTYTRRATPVNTQLVYKVWTAVDPGGLWTEDKGAAQHLDRTDADAGVETVTVTLSATKPLAAPKLFMRMTAE